MSRIVCLFVVSLLLVPSISAAQPSSGESAKTQAESSDSAKKPKDAKATKAAEAAKTQAGSSDSAKKPKNTKAAKAGKAAQPSDQSGDKESSGAEKALKGSKKEAEEKQPLSSVKQLATGLLNGKFGIQFLQDYTHLSSNQIYINGFGILPVLVVGQVDVQKVRRDLFTTTLTFSYKYTNNLQFAFRFPFQYSITRLSQPNGVTGNSVINAKSDTVTKSLDIGDLSAGLTYHLINQGLKMPDVYVGLNLKSRTGRDAFQTKNAQAHPPSGSGYDSILGLVSFDKYSAPALLFGSLSFSYGLPRKNVLLCPSLGQCVQLDYTPGPNIGLSAGMAISLNYQLTLNFGFQQSINFPSSINGKELANSATNVILMSLGGTWQFSPKHSLAVTFYQGVTSDSPDFRLGIRIPWQF